MEKSQIYSVLKYSIFVEWMMVKKWCSCYEMGYILCVRKNIFQKNWPSCVEGGVESVNFNINMRNEKTLKYLKYTQF